MTSRSGDDPGEANDSSRRASVARRVKTIPAVLGAFVLLTVLLPVLVAAAVAVDVVRRVSARRPWIAARLVAFLWVYLSAQVWGLAWMLASWVASGFGLFRARLERRTYRIQLAWARYLLAAVRVIFRLRLSVSGEQDAAPGPAIYLPRHASLIDTLLPVVLLTGRHGIRLRYVLKKELLIDPALDVAGNRLPNYFVDRGARNSRAELDAITRLGRGLTTDDGVLLYPEGTRFRPERQARLVARLSSKPELHELARSLQHVHPPRLGGALALLDSGADVVFIAHAGLDGFARVADVWSGSLVGSTIRVDFRRVPAHRIPSNRRERAEWLLREWRQVDADVGRMMADGG